MLTLENYIQQAPEIKTEINWHEVNNKRYVTLKKNFQIELLKRAIMNAGSQTKLIKFLRKSESQIRRYKKGEFNPTVDTLKRLAEIAKISFEDISKNIVCLGGITNPKLPFCMNNIYGIKIRAKILSDGFNTTNLNYNAGYRAGELESHKNLMLSFKKQIGDFHGEYGVTKPYRNAYSTQFPPVFGDILELSGVPRGWKSIKDPFIPKDILLSVTSLQVAYLCEAFTDEGCIEFSNGYRVVSLNRNIVLGNVNKFKNYTRGLPSEKSVSFKKLPGEFQNKIKGNIPKLILGEYLLLKKLDIDCKLKPKWIRINKNKSISLNWKILISNKRNLKLFEKIINFSIDTKRRKLKNIMESYEEGRTESGQGYRRALVVARSLTKQNKFFTSKQLANKLSICVRSATKYIKKMIENKDIIKIEGWKYATNTD